MKVLVVEDCGATQVSLEAFFRLQGCWTDHAGNGEAALTRLSVSRPDAIVTDHLMPGKTGVELIQELRSRKEFDNIPIALLSAVPADDWQIVLSMLGDAPRVRFFAKPVDPHAILAWLRDEVGKLP